MNTQKIVLLVAFVVVFGVGILIGKGLDTRHYFMPGISSNESQEVPSQGSEEAESGADAQTLEESAEGQVLKEPATIDTSRLTEGQKAMLKTLGIDADSLVITPEMAACAEAKIGRVRLLEIMEGRTPSLSEGASLYTCYRQ